MKYDNVNFYILIWSVVFLLTAISFIISNALQVLKEFRLPAIFGNISALSLLIFCIILSKVHGAYGALISLCIAEIVYLTFGIPLLKKLLLSKK